MAQPAKSQTSLVVDSVDDGDPTEVMDDLAPADPVKCKRAHPVGSPYSDSSSQARTPRFKIRDQQPGAVLAEVSITTKAPMPNGSAGLRDPSPDA